MLIIMCFIVKKRIDNKRKEQEKTTTIFKYKYSNVSFINNINNTISTNKKEIIFEGEDTEEIAVNEETKELICIGNNNKI